MNLVGWLLCYIGIVWCLLGIMRLLSRIEGHLAAMRGRDEKTDAGNPDV